MDAEKFKVVSMRHVGSCVLCGESMSTCATCIECGLDVCLDCAEEHACDGEDGDAVDALPA